MLTMNTKWRRRRRTKVLEGSIDDHCIFDYCHMCERSPDTPVWVHRESNAEAALFDEQVLVVVELFVMRVM
jgi:hypothetical protein